MVQKKWLLLIPVRMVALLMMVGCSQGADRNDDRRYLDSLNIALTAKIDSIQDSLEAVNTEYGRLSAQLDALRDSIAAAATARHKHPVPTIGGEAKGDPIRPNDPPRKEVR